MPVVDVLSYGRTEHVTLGPILDSEASINGNYRVMENIFLDQLQYNRETAFNDRLFLVYGDQKTAKLIRSCKEERVEAECAYDSHKWVVPHETSRSESLPEDQSLSSLVADISSAI